MKMKLYEMSTAINDIFNMVMDEDVNLNTLEDTLQCIEASIEEKVENGIALIKSLQAFSDSVKREKDFQDQRHKALENKIKRIKEYYKMNFDLIGKDKIVTKIGIMAVQKSTPSLQIPDVALLPAEYVTIIPQSYEANKEKIKVDLKLGKEIPGCCIIQGKHLRIR